MLSGSEYRPTLRALGGPNVLYLNSFTKKLLPALRLGFLVGSPETRATLVSSKRVSTLANVSIEDVHDRGSYADGTTASEGVTATDVVIRDVHGRGLDQLAGLGVSLIGGTNVLERVLIERVHECGLCATSDGVDTVSDVVVRDVVDTECSRTTCPGVGASVGVGVSDAAHLVARRFRIERVQSVGAQVAGLAGLDLADGLISSAPIGVNVQVPSYAFDRLTTLVTFEDVVVPLDAQYLPVPSAGSDAM